MRWHVVVLAAYLAGCSLIANPLDRFTFESADAGSPMDGGRDAGADAGSELDAASLDADFADAGPVPAAPALRYPWNGYRTGSALTGELEPSRNALRPLLMWDPVSAAAYYEVALSSDCPASTRAACDFSGAVVASSDTTSWRPESSLPVSMSPPVGTTYAWRVRACNASCGEWSEVRYLHVGRVPGDFNGDGYADVVVGAQDVDDTEMNEGAAYLYAGNGAGVGSVPTTFSNPDPVLMARFGNAVGSGGDLNGDGFEDLVVGAYLQGVVHIYFGSPTGPATTPDLTLTDPLEPIASAYG